MVNFRGNDPLPFDNFFCNIILEFVVYKTVETEMVFFDFGKLFFRQMKVLHYRESLPTFLRRTELMKTGEEEKSKLCYSTSHFGSFPAKKDVLQKEEFYYPMLLKVSR